MIIDTEVEQIALSGLTIVCGIGCQGIGLRIYEKIDRNSVTSFYLDENLECKLRRLRHGSSPQIFIMDIPEKGLHPASQCQLARLFSELVNLENKVFITTHSDYIIKELNTLIMLNQKEDTFCEHYGYKNNELLSFEKINVYELEENQLIKGDVDPFLGIEVKSFDQVISKMNEIQARIRWED